jgi:TRAP-type C4-dicarboxylate transport system permease small subunit
MAHGLDGVETVQAAALPRIAADRILAFTNDLMVKASSAALVLAGFVLTYSVIVRYFLKISTDWQDETSVFLIIGAVFLSSAAVQALRGHVAIETIVGLLPSRVNQARQIVVDLASLAFCAFFAWKSWALLHEAWVDDYHSGSTWGPPLWIPYSLMTIGMTLLSIQILLQVIDELRRWNSAR